MNSYDTMYSAWDKASGTLVNFHQTKQRHNLRTHHHQNLKSYLAVNDLYFSDVNILLLLYFDCVTSSTTVRESRPGVAYKK